METKRTSISNRWKSVIGRIPYLRNFRLRTLLIFFLSMAILASYLPWQLYRNRVCNSAADELRRLGCIVDLGAYPASRSNFTKQLPAGLIKAWQIIQPQTIGRVVLQQKMNSQQITEAIEQLKSIGTIGDFASYDAPVEVSHLETLLSRVRIRSLYVSQAKLPRGRMPCLGYQPLEWIYVGRSQFSDPAIDDLPISLKYFDATRTRITDQGLASFVRLKNLKTLILRRTQTTQEGIEKLQEQMPWCKIAWEPMVRR